MEKRLYNLSNPQKSLLLTEQYFQGSNINNICGTAIINNILDFESLEKAINEVIEKNDSFLTKLEKKDGTYVQFIKKYKYTKIELVRLNSIDELSTLENATLSNVFDIENKLFEFKMFEFPDQTGGFLLNIHHIIADGWSLGLVCRKVMLAYSKITGEEIEDISSSYIDYLNSEQDYVKSSKFENDKNYWSSVFETIPETVTIPGSLNSNEISSKANRKEFILSKSLVSSIQDFCAQNKISIFNFFTAILSIYMYKINNINDFVIGTPILNRTNFKEKKTIGMFVNVVPLRIKIDNQNNFIDFANSIAHISKDMLRHQKYSYTNILEDLRKTDSSIPGLYNIVLSYQLTKANNVSKYSYTTRWAFNGNCSEDIEIQIYDLDETGSLNLAFDYKIDKYIEKDIENLYNRLLYIIKQILEIPDINIKNIQITFPEEKDEILKINSNTKFNLSKNFVQIFEEHVKNGPNHIAVIDSYGEISYLELNNLANRIANFLKTKNVKQNSIISISMSRTRFFIASIIATLKLGCCYLPISTQYPLERIDFIIKDSNSSFLLTDYEIKIEFKNSININNIDLNNYSDENLNTNISLDDLAYVIYTSGSTGNPKGVMLKHSNLLNFVYNFNNQFEHKFSFDDNCLSLTNISFDVSVCEIFTPLIFSSCLVLYPENTLTNIPLLCEILSKNKITFLYLPPSLISSTYNFIKDNNIDFFVNKMLVGVEPIKNKTLNDFYTLNKNIEIVNGYGPTETTICCTFFKHKHTSKAYENEIVPIGKPLANNELLILNNDLNLVPINTFGEIYISGENVSKGYINRPDNNKSSFIKINEKIFYKTGDIAVLNDDKNIRFKGRNDSQIKFRGNRIELNEINNNIQKIPGVINSITSIKQINNTDYLCSYIATSKKIDDKYVKDYLKNILPHYMIPTHIMILKEFPLTPNGKIDKKSLPDFQIKENAIHLPETETEKCITKILEKKLQLKIKDISENIFDLGADSLIAIELVSEIYSKLDKKITIQDIFKNPSILELSKFIDNTALANKDIKINHVTNKDSYPISAIQEGIYYSSTLSDNTVYNMTGGIEIFSKVDKNKLKKCFNELIKKHASFRTKFEFEDGTIVQKILPKVNIEIEEINGSNISKNKLFNNFDRKFDFSVAPLLRVGLAKISENHYIILISTHHIVADGYSFKIFIEDFCKLYNGQKIDSPKIDYIDYSEFEKNGFENGAFEEAENYWVTKLKDNIPILNLPTNFARPSSFTYAGSRISKTINKSLSKSILNFCKENGITPFMFMISVYYILLYKYSNNAEILVGTPASNRTFHETSDIIGMFVNTLVFKATINDDDNFIELLKNIKEISLENFKYQNYPFSKLIKKLNIKRDPSRNVLFDTMFIYQNNGMPDLSLLGKANYILPDSKTSKFDLSLEVVPNESTMELNFEYCTDLFTKEFIKDLSENYIQLIKNVLKVPDNLIKNIDILPKTEKNRILYYLNKTELSYPNNKTIPELFEQQVLKTPDKIAAVFEDTSLSFEELNKKANALAHYLKNNGITRGNIVGILLNRSIEMLICIFAILKSGAAYVPIDPNYPEHRIKYILENSFIKIVLSEESLINKFDINSQIINAKLSNKNIYNNNLYENLNIKISPDDLSYIIYTSGSTGNPKGVMLTHKGVVNLIYSIKNRFKFNNNYNMVSLTTICFDIFVFESIYPLCTGMTTVITNSDEQNIPQFLNKLCKKNNVKILQTTPSRLGLLLNDENSLDFIRNAKYIVMGGEAVPPNLIKKLKNLTNARLINGYGPTECTVYASFKDLTDTDEINIGTPVANSHMYILDNNMNVLPIGVPGNLYISGDGVGKGYLNRDNLTEEKFINDLFNPGKIMYDTGDVAKFMPNGDVYYIGRSDFQVKIHGLRIELEEIEKQISSFKNISTSAVCVKKDSSQRDILCAYFIADRIISINNLKEYLRKKLPTYMIPLYFKQITEFKHTPNGKIDRKNLPTPEFAKNITKIISPETETEKLLTKIVQNILAINPISITDNLFDLGADSLTALRLQIDLLSEGINVPYSDIFKYNTIKDLALRIDSNINTEVTLHDDNYDYTKINDLLSKNNIKNIQELKYEKLGNVILTGATGFLGIHILNEILSTSQSIVYCLIRKGNNGLSIEDKLKDRLNSYFGNKFDNELGKRIIPIESNICDENLELSKYNYDFLKENSTCIINCAANVKHYGYYSDFENVNVIGTKNLIKLAISGNLKFIQISTASVSGNTLVGEKSKLNNLGGIVNYNEQSFFKGQSFENVYVYSKFEAEKLVFENIINNGLNGLVLRVGYITPRYSDGMFQINKLDNAHFNRIQTFIKLRVIPKYLQDFPVEFTPVDYLAKAIIKSIQYYNNKINVLHLYNPNHIIIKEFIKIINKDINIISDDKFKNYLKQILKDSSKRNIISSIINDLDEDFNIVYSSDIRLNNDFTIEFLNKIGFKWPIIDKKYINLILYLFDI